MVLVHLAYGFEEIEAVTITDVLRRAGIDAKFVAVPSVADSQATKAVTGAHGITVEADLLYEEADYEACKMIVLPGGMPGTTNLGKHTGLAKQIKAFAAAEKYVAAICAAPMVLGTLGVLEGKAATIFPGMEGYLTGAAVNEKDRVVVDGNIITSKGPGTAAEFAVELVRVLKGDRQAESLIADMLIK